MLIFFAACAADTVATPATERFPYVYTAESGLKAYETVRFETETWLPEEDPEELALYLLKAATHRKGAPVESLAHFETMRGAIQPLGQGKRLTFAGDTMWIGENWSHYADPVATLFDGDLNIANLETPTSPNVSSAQGDLGLYAFNAPPEMLDGLPVDLLQLNNNHSLDAGDAGLEDTIVEVEARGIATTGVDTHRTLDGVAFLSYTWGTNVREPSEHQLYIVPFGHLDGEPDLDGVAADLAAARDDAEFVVVLLHWGFEYEYYPDPHFMVIARELVAAGADLIVGTGPHVVQPPEWCVVNQPEVEPGVGTCSVSGPGPARTAAVLYSLGNFASSMSTAPCEVGILATASLGGGGVTGLGWRGVANVDGAAGLEVRPLADVLDDADLAAEDARLRAHLGGGW